MDLVPPVGEGCSGSGERRKDRGTEADNASVEEQDDLKKSEVRRTNSGESEMSSGQGFDPVIKQGNPDEMDNDKVNLDAIKNTLLSGVEDELLIALFETQQILKNCQDFAVQVLVPIICERVIDWTYNIKLSAAEALMAAVISGIPPSLARDISDAAFKIINTPCDQSMCEFWGDLLVATLPGVTWSPSKLDEVMDLLEMRYAESGNALSRQLAARTLGSLATCSTDDDVKKRIMDRAIVITDDKDPQVRGMVAESLASIGASMHISIVERDLWPCLLKLLRDEDARIHAASIRSLSLISEAHRETQKAARLFTELLPPVFLQECITIRRDAAQDLRTIDEDLYLLLEINAQVFGKLLYCCFEHIQDEVARKGTFKAFLAMATCNGPVIRKHCAFNMPAVSVCLRNPYGARLSSVVEYMSHDTNVETRWMLAAGMHETSRVLATSETKENLFNTVLVLLKDPEFLVRNAVLEHFEELIMGFAKQFGYKSAQKFAPVFKNLQLLAEGQWRTQALLAKQLQYAAPLVPPPSLKMDVLPMLYQMAEAGASRVRKAAMEAVAICIRCIPDLAERDKVMKAFSVEWANGTVYWMRIAFIDSAVEAVRVYSRCLFRDTYGSQLLRLANDNVPNVRLRMALLLPHIAPACHQMEEFESAIQALKRDEDKDVREAMDQIDEVIHRAINKGSSQFEGDMKLEDEEQDLYSRHLLAQREIQRAKNAMKRRPGALFGKAAKGLYPGSSRGSSQTMMDDIELAFRQSDSRNAAASAAAAPKKSNSFVVSAGGNSPTKFERKGKPKLLASPKRSPGHLKQQNQARQTHVEGADGSSPLASGPIRFKGLMQLMSPKTSSANSRRGKGGKRSIA